MSDFAPTQLRSQADLDAESLCVLVISDDTVTTHPLPHAGRVTIGRAPGCEIQLADALASREHLILHLGDGVELEDLGSANGTFFRDERLEAHARLRLRSGQAVRVGDTNLLLQRTSATRRRFRLHPHSHFEVCLDDACAHLDASSPSFAVVRIRVVADADAAAIEGAFLEVVRPGQVVAYYAPGEYEVLLPRHDRVEADTYCDVLAKALSTLGGTAEFGVAVVGVDGRDAHALIATASERLLGPGPSSDLDTVIVDESMHDLYTVAGRVARGSLSVLLLGETGVGKEVFAEAIHRASPRTDGVFVRLNCAAFSENLLESELFGHAKGAFTGATAAKKGLLEVADGGTVFLDELGELPQSLQAKLLRVLENGQLQRVGDLRPRSVDVRFVSATNRDLEMAVARGEFRQDLYFRLNGVILAIPPLRERGAEIAPLAERFLGRAAASLGLERAPAIAERTHGLLAKYSWPGNIRELKNVMERAVLLCTGDTIDPEHLPFEKMTTTWVPAATPRGDTDARKQRIIDALAECSGNQTRAAAVLGVSRQTLSTWLDKYDIPRPRKGTRK